MLLLISCSVKHQYQLHFVDENNNQLDSVSVSSEILTIYPKDSKKEIIIPESKDYLLNFKVEKLEGENSDIYHSYVMFNISRPGYFDKHIELNSYYKTEGEVFDYSSVKKRSSEEEIVYEQIELFPLMHHFKIDINNSEKFLLYGKYNLNNGNNETIEREIILNDKSDYLLIDSVRPYPIYDNISNDYIYRSKLKIWLNTPGYKPVLEEIENNINSDSTNYMNSTIERSIKMEKYKHQYIFNIVDDKFMPLSKVKASYSKESLKELGNYEEVLKDNILEVNINPQFEEWTTNKLKSPTKIKITFSKFGYETVDTTIASDISEDLNNDGIFNVTIKLAKKGKDYLKNFKWSKTYKDKKFEYLPDYKTFVNSINELMEFIDSTDIDNLPSKTVFKTLKNEDGVIVNRIYRDLESEDITKEFILDVVELYPEYKDSLRSQIYNYLLHNDTSTYLNRDIVLAYYNAFKKDNESPYFLYLYSNTSPLYFFIAYITETFFEDMKIIEDYWDEIRLELLKEANLKLNNNKHVKAKLIELFLEDENYDEAFPLLSTLIQDYPDYSYTNYFKSQIYSNYDLYKYFINNKKDENFKDVNFVSEYLIKALETSNDKIIDVEVDYIFREIAKNCIDYRADIIIDTYNKFKDKIINSFNNNDLNIILTSSYYNIEDYKNAIFYANEIIKKDKNNLFGYLSLADIERAKKNYKKAVEYYDKAYKIDPTNFSAVYNQIISLYNIYDCKKLNKLFDELNFYDFEDEERDELNDLKRNCDRKCNPEIFVSGRIKSYFYCPDNYGYDESCIYKVDVEFTNNSYQNVKKVLIEIEIIYNNKTYYKHRGWINVELIPDSVLVYTIKLKNKVKIWDVHASESYKYVRVIDVK